MGSFTKRNHYNPCFWTALWNPVYFDAFVRGSTPPGPARDQELFVLNLRADQTYSVKASKVHYERALGVAEITPEEMKSFCKRWYPSEYANLSQYVEQHPEHLFLDFEDILNGIEQKGLYDSLLHCAKVGDLTSVEEKGFLTGCIVIHAMRSHELMTGMIGSSQARGIPKWEYFWLLKNAWSNPLILMRAALPLAMGQWTFYHTAEDTFPLPDSPVMIGEHGLMVVLSPRLLLEVSLLVQCPEDVWRVRERISPSKYREFRRRAVRNTFKEIVFSDKTRLDDWRHASDCRVRIRDLSDPATRDQILAESSARVIWGINGFGRVPPDFEQWIQECSGA